MKTIAKYLLITAACLVAVLIWASLWAEFAEAQPDSIPRYTPPDSLLPWCYDGIAWGEDRFPGLTPAELRSFGILITDDARNASPAIHHNGQGLPRAWIPLAFADDRIPPFDPGWPDEIFGIGGWTMPQGMPDLYYQCVYWIGTGTWEGHLAESVADGAWHYNSVHIPDTITWDCCPPSLWPHPSGCVRILGRWWRDPETGYWSHWLWQVRWNSAVGGYWEIVGGIPGGGWWSPHLGPWVMSQKSNQ